MTVPRPGSLAGRLTPLRLELVILRRHLAELARTLRQARLG